MSTAAPDPTAPDSAVSDPAASDPAASDPAAPVLALRGIRQVHGRGAAAVTALDGIDLEVRAGEFVAIMGASGSGKSTLLHLAGGLVDPVAGQVLIQGQVLGPLDAAERARLRRTRIGYVFQELNLLPVLTALENVSFPLELDGRSPRAAAAAAREALAALGVAHLASRMPAQLSGGEAQRVAIARAVVGPRTLLLADEATGALDSTTGTEVVALLRERADAGLAVVLVTHEARLAAWADRTVQLRDGRIVGGAAPFDPEHLLIPTGPGQGPEDGYGYPGITGDAR